MKYIKIFEDYEDTSQSVKHIYKRFSLEARKSIDDNFSRFEKIAKKVFYNKDKDWKDYFKNKDVKKIKTLTEVMNSLEKWLENK